MNKNLFIIIGAAILFVVIALVVSIAVLLKRKRPSEFNDLINTDLDNYNHKTKAQVNVEANRENLDAPAKAGQDTEINEDTVDLIYLKAQPLDKIKIVLLDYDPINSEEIKLTAGDQIKIITKYNDGMCLCYNLSSLRHGLVPISCLESCLENDAKNIK